METPADGDPRPWCARRACSSFWKYGAGRSERPVLFTLSDTPGGRLKPSAGFRRLGSAQRGRARVVAS
jgi:hypothetical protein